MHRTHLLAAAAAGLVLAGSVQSGSSASAPSRHPMAAPSAVAPNAAVKGYTIATSKLFVDAAGSQTEASVSCPTGLIAISGGADIDGSSPEENLNGSLPFSKGSWGVYVDNSSSTDGTFRAYAVCVKKFAKYSLAVSKDVTNPTGTQATATVSCPGTTVPLGGGGVGGSLSPLQSLASSIPQSNGWRVDVNNASSRDDTATAYAVCGAKPTSYVQVSGPAVPVESTSQAPATAACPTGTVALSGGAASDSASTLVNLNSTRPTSTTTWQSYENNASDASTALTPYVVCGKTA